VDPKDKVYGVLREFSREMKTLFGSALKGVILYGSYARGDFDQESDIDVMVLVDVPRARLHNYDRILTKLSQKVDKDSPALLSVFLKNAVEFETYKDDLPFYANIDREGVRIA
jgi:predicted nucleotidyltransferase